MAYDKLTHIIGVIAPEAVNKLVLLQELHNKQIAAMMAKNKANMDVMMARITAWFVPTYRMATSSLYEGKAA